MESMCEWDSHVKYNYCITIAGRERLSVLNHFISVNDSLVAILLVNIVYLMNKKRFREKN